MITAVISLPWCHEFVIMIPDYYGMAAIVDCQQDIRFSKTHNASQTKQPSASWIQYSQQTAMPAGTPTKF